MHFSDKAIVLNAFKHKDNAFVVKAFTLENGLQSFYINVGKKDKTKLGFTFPFGIYEVEFLKSKKTDLLKVKEVKGLCSVLNLRTNIYKSTMVLFLAEVLCYSLPQNQKDESCFNYLESYINQLELVEDNFSNYHIQFLLKFTQFLGFYPHFEDNFKVFDLDAGCFINYEKIHPNVLSKEDSSILARFLQEKIGLTLPMLGKDRLRLLREVLKYYSIHLQGFNLPKSLPVLEEVFG